MTSYEPTYLTWLAAAVAVPLILGGIISLLTRNKKQAAVKDPARRIYWLTVLNGPLIGLAIIVVAVFFNGLYQVALLIVLDFKTDIRIYLIKAYFAPVTGAVIFPIIVALVGTFLCHFMGVVQASVTGFVAALIYRKTQKLLLWPLLVTSVITAFAISLPLFVSLSNLLDLRVGKSGYTPSPELP